MAQIAIEELKKEAYDNLKDLMIDSLEKGSLTSDEVQESARYISFHLDPVESTIELLLFLEDLAGHWPAYQMAYINFKSAHELHHQEQKVTEIQDKLKQFINTQTPK